MRVHLPALVALVSAATYAACGSSDPSVAVQAGGAAGEGGDSSSSGGSNTIAGSSNSAGTQNVGGGQAGEGSGGAPVGGQGGAASGGEDTGMLGGAFSAAGAGGAGDTPDTSLPAQCPGVAADYTLLLGTESDDAFMTADVSGKKLIFGLGGVDTFPKEHGGDDCIIGGPGDDDFTNSDEFANYYFGGTGADTYHIDTSGNYVRIADLENGDTIALSQTKFAFLAGTPGDTPDAAQVKAVAGYSTGTSSGVVEASSIIYDPDSGELWLDWDGGTKGSSVNDVQILTVLNNAGYTFDIADFEID